MKTAFFRFFQDDWLRDTRQLSLSAKGAWIDFIAYAWSNASSMLQATVPEWCRMLGASEAEFTSVLSEWKKWGIAEIQQAGGLISVECRRMRKDLEIMEVVKEQNKAKAKKAARSRWSSHAPSNASSIPPSNASSNAGSMLSAASSTSATSAASSTSERDAVGHPRTVQQPEAPKTDSLLPAGAGGPLKVQESEKREPQAQEIEEWKIPLLMFAKGKEEEWKLGHKRVAARWVASLTEPPQHWERELAAFAYS